MTYRGTMQNGVVVLRDAPSIPDGTEVNVSPVAEAANAEAQPPEFDWRKLMELARSFENRPTEMPPDMAANHDHYLHGLPKRRP